MDGGRWTDLAIASNSILLFSLPCLHLVKGVEWRMWIHGVVGLSRWNTRPTNNCHCQLSVCQCLSVPFQGERERLLPIGFKGRFGLEKMCQSVKNQDGIRIWTTASVPTPERGAFTQQPACSLPREGREGREGDLAEKRKNNSNSHYSTIVKNGVVIIRYWKITPLCLELLSSLSLVNLIRLSKKKRE